MKRWNLIWLGCVVAGSAGWSPAEENWPQFRGPRGTLATAAHDLPVALGPEKNVVWKVALPGHSAASPAVWGEHVWVVSPDEAGDVYLFDFDPTGHERWRLKVGQGNHTLGFNKKNNFASPSPATDGQHVWVLAGSGELSCVDLAGQKVWTQNVHQEYGEYQTGFGIGFSPILFRDALYFPYLHQGESSVIALSKATGKLKWRTARRTIAEEESKDSYTTACVFEQGDRAEVVVAGADLANAYDSQTGQELWHHGDINPERNKTLRIVVSPVADRERIYVSTAKRGPVYAIRPGGSGDVTKTHRVWSRTEETPDVPTPAVDNGLIYILRENGVLSVCDAATCQEHYQHRVAEQAGAFSASPVVADGKVFLCSERGLVVVVAAGPQYQHLAENDLGELIMATPAVVGQRVYIRTTGHLICFGKSS